MEHANKYNKKIYTMCNTIQICVVSQNEINVGVGLNVREGMGSKLRMIKSSSVAGLEWPRGFQEVKVPRFRYNGTGWW